MATRGSVRAQSGKLLITTVKFTGEAEFDYDPGMIRVTMRTPTGWRSWEIV